LHLFECRFYGFPRSAMARRSFGAADKTRQTLATRPLTRYRSTFPGTQNAPGIEQARLRRLVARRPLLGRGAGQVAAPSANGT
jgi:hypothetical protein